MTVADLRLAFDFEQYKSGNVDYHGSKFGTPYDRDDAVASLVHRIPDEALRTIGFCKSTCSRLASGNERIYGSR